MLLKANKYRKDKKADCRQNELGSRIFMGRVFGDYAECLHFYPSFSYGRIIAGERGGVVDTPAPVTSAHSAGSFTGSATGVVKWLFRWAVGTETEKAS